MENRYEVIIGGWGTEFGEVFSIYFYTTDW